MGRGGRGPRGEKLRHKTNRDRWTDREPLERHEYICRLHGGVRFFLLLLGQNGDNQWTLLLRGCLRERGEYPVNPGLAAAWAVGTFEVQIHQVQNAYGLLQDGECCDGRSVGGSRCSPSDQCDTFFRACLKEYQVRVAPTGTCTFGTGSTAVLGGNSFSLRHHGHGGGGENSSGRIAIPFKYAWPVSSDTTHGL
uniref:Notch ligand N-terminal domain-containing protein n=1 Tax=Scleropages formosus TaxID=113540 RepID=A0A8C9RD36_SCLFO